MEEDLYKILGLDKTASKSEIKKAYKKLAMKHHPDRGGDEEEFKKVNNAFSILSDDNKKAQYDRFGTTDGMGGNPFGNGNPFSSAGGFDGFGDAFADMFSQFGGGGGSYNTYTKQKRGSDLRINLVITFKEAFEGTKKNIKLQRKKVCTGCSGEGGTGKKSCTSCNGTGKVRQVTETPLGLMERISACQSCNAKGHTLKNACDNCHGRGTVNYTDTIDIEIPRGVDSNMQIRKSGFGNEIKGGQDGDLLIEINVLKEKGYVRQGDDIYLTIDVSISDILLGCEKFINYIDGKELKIKVDELHNINNKITIRNKGFYNVNYRDVRGNLVIITNLVMPKELSDSDKEIIKKLDI